MKGDNMKKAFGFILAFILTIGIAFGAQQVISSRNATSKPTTSKQVASTSSSATSSSNPSQSNRHQKAKDEKKAKASSNKRTPKVSDKQHTAKSQSSANPSQSTGSNAKASSNKTVANKQTKVSKADKLGKINHKAETKVVKDSHHAAKKTGDTKNTIQIHLTVDGYKKVFYSKNMRVKKGANAFSILKQTSLKISYIPGPSIYVNGINGLKENDVKAGSGWMFSVNKKFIDHAANLTKLKSGDNVRWYFTTKGY